MSRLFIFFEKVNKGQLKTVRSRQCHFNKIIKGPETSLRSPALSQKYVRNVGHRSN